MKNTWTIYRRETAAFFNSPVAYIFICSFLAIMSFLFFLFYRFFSQSNPDLRVYFEILMPWVFCIFIPAITMRLWSEEKKQSTIEILMTLPISTWEVVVAKFLASYTIVAVSILLTIFIPISISFVLPLDGTALVANYVGTFLIAGVYIAIGAWLSALTENQVVAFVLAAAVSAVVCLIGWYQVTEAVTKALGSSIGQFLAYFGTYYHNQRFAQGQISAVSIIYCLSMIGLFLGLNNLAVESRKY